MTDKDNSADKIRPEPTGTNNIPPERSYPEYIHAVSERGSVRSGAPLPLGAHHRGNGANFAIFSRNATRITLELFEHPEDTIPVRTIKLDSAHNRSGDVWHTWIKDVRPGQLYAYRVEGPYQPQKGQRFNSNKRLLDPYATAITMLENWDFAPALGYDPNSSQRDLSCSKIDDAGAVPLSIFTQDHFTWDESRRLSVPWSETIIYEVHVRGFSIHPSSKVSHPGTYRGMIEKIPYLKSLGVTVVELMPVQEFNENEMRKVNPLTGEKLKNYWGYDPVSFFAPKASYCSSGKLGHQKLEFKEMVREFHRAGIELILDVVFNHTAEGNELGPTLCFRGLDNSIFYMLEDNQRYYRDDTGTGNTVNANHPVVRDFILDALRYWTVEMHVDGFRFDLASVLGRDEHGNLLSNAPILERIAEDPILRDVKLIAEAWDAAGAYQVGSFSEKRWAEWNGHYRDDVRRFWRGDPGMQGIFASRICGSSDIYQGSGKGPESSINFITCHDGFTLNDLVSFNHKHNQANGDSNRDGMDENYSYNYGTEGPTADPGIEQIRIQQIKNFLLTLFISRGVPMLLGGDEFRRTQDGNNNAYCQDNETSWYIWDFLYDHQDIYRFTRKMIEFRKSHPVLSRETFYTMEVIQWFNQQGNSPDWFDPQEKWLACRINDPQDQELFLIFNPDSAAHKFNIPDPKRGGNWRLAADTSRPSPEDIFNVGEEIPLETQDTYQVKARSSAILIAQA